MNWNMPQVAGVVEELQKIRSTRSWKVTGNIVAANSCNNFLEAAFCVTIQEFDGAMMKMTL